MRVSTDRKTQLLFHTQLADQYSQIGYQLRGILRGISSNGTALTPGIHSLSGVVEILNFYYRATSIEKALKKVLKKGLEAEFEKFEELRTQIEETAKYLDKFIPPDKKPQMKDGKIPLESLIELSIQCYLDCVVNQERERKLTVGTDLPHLTFLFRC